jgi:hypothetical protein
MPPSLLLPVSAWRPLLGDEPTVAPLLLGRDLATGVDKAAAKPEGAQDARVDENGLDEAAAIKVHIAEPETAQDSPVDKAVLDEVEAHGRARARRVGPVTQERRAKCLSWQSKAAAQGCSEQELLEGFTSGLPCAGQYSSYRFRRAGTAAMGGGLELGPAWRGCRVALKPTAAGSPGRIWFSRALPLFRWAPPIVCARRSWRPSTP